MRQDSVALHGTGRVPNPRDLDDHPEDWSWQWECHQCGVASRKTTAERAREWADHHRCGDDGDERIRADERARLAAVERDRIAAIDADILADQQAREKAIAELALRREPQNHRKLH